MSIPTPAPTTTPPTTHDTTIQPALAILSTLRHILQKAESSHPNPQSLLSSRLHETMYALPDQIRCLTQFTEYLAARLSAREPTTLFAGVAPASWTEIYERIQKAQDILNSLDKGVVNEQGVTLKPTPRGPAAPVVDMSGAAYASVIVLPNIYFHLVTIYAILRSQGVELGKMDYYQGFFPMQGGW
ncbi:DUF1993 domain-containing protein [Aspergillus stella-maris]|uniref:DUF1993 domain-containing protein n=1 Tax=Aspergillus stella-maris TaxID=1810926 RepID=UPI003CCCC9CC